MGNILLIVDDAEDMARTLRRCLAPRFEQTHTAASSREAEEVCAKAQPPVTHLVCDQTLGDDSLPGTSLVPRLRAVCSSLKVAALVTGLEPKAIPQVAGIDRVFRKPVDIGVLADFLLAAGS